jgi:riboflavin synthase
MFTGIVTELGTVESLVRSDVGARLRVAARLAGGLGEGESVAVDGACLTAAVAEPGAFEADVMNRTLELTTLGRLAPGDRVNLEPALRAGQPLGGHLVQGHVDAAAEVAALTEDGIAKRLRVRLDDGLDRYAVERGSVTLAGVSLTVVRAGGGEVEVSLIPETLARTTLGELAEGDPVNVELDVVARYVERLLRFNQEGK